MLLYRFFFDFRRSGFAQSTEDALIANLANKRISRKINYDAMSAIFDSEGGFSTENLTSKRSKETGEEEDEIEEEIVEEETIFRDV